MDDIISKGRDTNDIDTEEIPNCPGNHNTLDIDLSSHCGVNLKKRLKTGNADFPQNTLDTEATT